MKYKSEKPGPTRSQERATEFVKKKYIERRWVPNGGALSPVEEYNEAMEEGREPDFSYGKGGDGSSEEDEEEDSGGRGGGGGNNVSASGSGNPFGFVKKAGRAEKGVSGGGAQSKKGGSPFGFISEGKSKKSNNSFGFVTSGSSGGKKSFKWGASGKKKTVGEKKTDGGNGAGLNPFGFLSKQNSKQQQPDLK